MPLTVDPGLLMNAADYQVIPAVKTAISVYASYMIGAALSGKGVGLTTAQAGFIVAIGVVDPKGKQAWIDRLVLWIGAEHELVWPGKSVDQVTQELDGRMGGPGDADRQLLDWLNINVPTAINAALAALNPPPPAV